MKLLVRVIEARNLPASDRNVLCDPYVKVQLGKQKFKTEVVKKNLNPSWCEEFSFMVDDLNGKLVFSVLYEDKYLKDYFIGLHKIPVSRVFDSETKSLCSDWYPLKPKSKKTKNTDCGTLPFFFWVFLFWIIFGTWVFAFLLS